MASTARIDDIKKKFDENPRRYFAPLANEFRKMGDLEQAIMICEEFLPQQPGHMSGHIVYGQSLFEAGRLPEARTVFETALGLDPENLIALRHLGDIARSEGDVDGARSWYKRVLDADPRNEEIQGLLAQLDAAPEAAPGASAPASHESAPSAPPAESTVPTVVITALPVAPPRTPSVVSHDIEPLDLDDDFAMPATEPVTASAPEPAREPAPASPPEAPKAPAPVELDVTLPFGMPAIPAPSSAPSPAPPTTSDSILPPDVPFEELTLDGLEPTHADHHGADVAHVRAEGLQTSEFEAPSHAPRAEGLEPLEFEPPAAGSTDESLLDLEGSLEPTGSVPAVAPLPGLESDMSPPPTVGELPMLDVDEGAAPPHGDVFALGALAPDESLALPTEPAGNEPPRMGPPAAMEAMPALELDELPMGELTDLPPSLPITPMAAASPAAEAPAMDLPAVEAPAEQMLELPPEVIAAESVLMDRRDTVEQVEAATPAASAAAEPPAPAATPFVTETMAELYVKQGFRDQALAVYRQLSAAAPHDDRLRARVEELEREPVAPAAATGPTVREFFSRLAARRPGERAAAFEPPADDDFAPLPPRAESDAPPPSVMSAPEPAPEPAPAAAPAPAPQQAMTTGVERGAVGAGRATPAGSIDALFGNRAPASSEDSAASALAQAFGGKSETEILTGRPARAAKGELSLDSVFRDGAARPPRASQSFSFDQFFSESAAETPSSAPEPAAPKPAERSADDIEQFNSWLQGLKQR